MENFTAAYINSFQTRDDNGGRRNNNNNNNNNNEDKKRKYVDIRYDSSSDDDSDEVEIGENVLHTKLRQFKKIKGLGLNVNDAFITIPEIQNRELPREDGYSLDVNDAIQRKYRPYGKEYLHDQEERLRIMANDESFRFLGELAGSIRKDAREMFEQEDITRVMNQRVDERQSMQIERKRTLTTMSEKHSMIKKMEPVLTELKDTIEKVKASEPDESLYKLSTSLIGSPVLQESKEKKKERKKLESEGLEDYDDNEDDQQVSKTGFIPLIQLLDSLRVATESVNAKNVEGFRYYLGRVNVLYPNNRRLLKSMEKQMSTSGKLSIYIWFIYYTYFLNNDTDTQTMDEIITNRASYITNIYADVTDGDNEETLTKIKFESPPNKILSPIDWSLYRHTETLNMEIFNDVLNVILNSIEKNSDNTKPDIKYDTFIRDMLLGWKPQQYDINIWVTLIKYIYPIPALDNLPVAVNFSQAPYSRQSYILLLLKKTNPDISVLSEDEVKNIVLSHLLWVYFNENDYYGITLAFMRVDSIRRQLLTIIVMTISTAQEKLELVKNVYQPVVISYLNRVRSYLDGIHSFINPKQRVLIVNLAPVIKNEVDLVESNKFYRRYKNLSDLVRDDIFRQFIRTGVLSLISSSSKSISKPEVSIFAKDYLTETLPEDFAEFSLHILFKYYYNYQSKYLTYLVDEQTSLRRALDKARGKIQTMLGDESIDRNITEGNPMYNQRKAFTTDPINSGFIQIKTEIRQLIENGLDKVYDYCENLRDLPLEGFHSASARSKGLTVKFINYLSALYARNDLLHPEKYNTAHHQENVALAQKNTMDALQKYGYTQRGNRYTIFTNKNTNDVVSRILKPTYLRPNATPAERDNYYNSRLLTF